ncbi:hypothetical protein JEQ12_010431 [Ovis aries]|uniref:Uncharacterized protein n=1 Tax=Ovis aries TaxID=9940 RepID=A0A836CS43_SHEEP|nr:hypothetical protein JEQ12_010431 [Ovis aries]
MEFEKSYMLEIESSSGRMGKPLEVKTLTNASVANINVSVLLGKGFDYQNTPFLRLLTLTDQSVRLIVSRPTAVPEKDTSDYFSDDTLVVLVNNLFAAGTESTVSTLRWGILFMSRYPEIQR